MKKRLTKIKERVKWGSNHRMINGCSQNRLLCTPVDERWVL